ncbi:AAA family ATPase [Pectobacterium sp. A5351]|uniref:AAA family ATPase n=1 Tax=Pectobacterium sp. A5351 TaxID=2914983 RepID=UPI00232D8277|nr:AAA family ATPase [Pectobacterium sp. A5351]WCG83161.1 AAA family ATPase [Pectobacterium sp. A5351]
MRNIAGSPVEGDNFFGREAETKRLCESLADHDVLLLGPRRIGKTSIARKVMIDLQQQNWQVLEINVASCQNEVDFLDKLKSALSPLMNSTTRKITTAIGDTLASLSKRIKKVSLSIPGAGSLGVDLAGSEQDDWMKIANSLLHLIGQTRETWLIYIDELPIFLFNIIKQDPIHGVVRVRRFLDWFRNDVRALPENRHIHWLITGSVGLDTLVQEHGMADTINSLKHENLAAFSPGVAVEMLLELAKNYEIAFSPEAARCLVDAVQWPQPYYLQKAFNELRACLNANMQVAMEELIEQVIDSLIEPSQDNDFHHWEARLSIQLKSTDALYAQEMLTAASQSREGATVQVLQTVLLAHMDNATQHEVKQTFIRLRDILLRDAYWWLDERGGERRYRFHLEPLRRWWKRKNTL